jgi:hypothetical protein
MAPRWAGGGQAVLVVACCRHQCGFFAPLAVAAAAAAAGPERGGSERTCYHEGSAVLSLHLAHPSDSGGGGAGRSLPPPPLGLVVPLAMEPFRHPSASDVVAELAGQFADLCASQVRSVAQL